MNATDRSATAVLEPGREGVLELGVASGGLAHVGDDRLDPAHAVHRKADLLAQRPPVDPGQRVALVHDQIGDAGVGPQAAQVGAMVAERAGPGRGQAVPRGLTAEHRGEPVGHRHRDRRGVGRELEDVPQALVLEA